MAGNEHDFGIFRDAKPVSGDLVDRFLEGNLRRKLFGEDAETTLGRLRIDGPLGSGAMGAVLSAFDPILDRHVAIKSLRPERTEEGDRLIAEARLLAKLDHRNVVSVYDVISEGDAIHLVMERVDGVSLREWMAESHSPAEVIGLFAQIAQGLAAAHDLDIAHCDIKPENIVVSGDRPMLIDFGLAFEVGEGVRFGGTTAYLAPERRAGSGGSPEADQYAFFASLYEVIEGRRPDDEVTFQQTPSRYQSIIRRGLAGDPKARWGDMGDVASALEPRRSGRWLAVGAVLACVGALGLGVFLARGSAKDQVCAGSGAALEEVWNQDARAALRAGLGSKASDTIEPSFVRYFETWRDLRRKSCLATRVHGEQSEELLDFSMRCLDSRLRSAGSLVEVFSSEPNERIIERASRLTASLEPLEACLDPESLSRALPLPQSPEALEDLRRLEQDIEALKNLDRRGEFREALVLAGKLRPRADALGYPPITATLLVLTAGLHATLGDHEAADATLRVAATAAAEARDDRLLAEVWIRLLDLLALQGRYDEALTLEPVAQTSVTRVKSDRRVAARLHNSLGGIYLAKARYADAYDQYEAALALQREIGSKDNPALAPAIANFGLAKWYRGDLAGALENQREALTLMQDDLGRDHSRVAYGHQNVGDLLIGLGSSRYAEAKSNYREALRIWTASLGDEHANLAHPHEKLAWIAAQQRDFAAARPHLAAARRLRIAALGNEHPLVLQTLVAEIDLEIDEASASSLSRAEELTETAVSFTKKLGAAGKRYAAYPSEARARIAEARGRWKRALAAHVETARIRSAEFGDDHMSVAGSFAQAGRIAIRLRRFGDAAAHLGAAQRIYDGTPDSMGEHRIRNRQDRASLHLARKNYAGALELLEEALALATETKSHRAFDVRFDIAKARYQAGEKVAALALATKLAAELDGRDEAELPALSGEVKAWLSASQK